MDIGDYVVGKWCPPEMALFQSRQLWFQRPEVWRPDPMPPKAVYLPALPTVGNALPSPNLYSDTLGQRLSDPFHWSSNPQQVLADLVTTDVWQRDPYLSAWNAELGSGGAISLQRWNEFGRTNDGARVKDALGFGVGSIYKAARKQLASAIRSGGRYTIKSLTWLLDSPVPTPTPAGLAIAVIRMYGQQKALDLAERGARAVIKYVEKHPRPPYPGGPVRPPWLPRPGGPMIADAGISQGDSLDTAQYMAVATPPELQDAVFVVTEDEKTPMPRYFVNFFGTDLR